MAIDAPLPGDTSDQPGDVEPDAEKRPLVEDEHHAHHHRTGLPWLDMILAGSAMLVSLISLFVSIEHGRTMERLVDTNARQVRASTLPVLRFSTGNIDTSTGEPTVHLDISNGGTGPAIIEWLTLRYARRPLANVAELLNACCRADPSRRLSLTITNIASGQTLSPGQSNAVFAARQGSGDPGVYRRLEREGRFRVEPTACFCSVLDECWITDFRHTRPRPVASCGTPPGGRW